ncbi:hypothetical protein P4544_14835 [Halomonas sp. LY9]
MKGKLFSSYVKKYIYQPHYRLFDNEVVKLLKDYHLISDSSIYSIVRVRKAKFIPESFHPVSNYSLRGKIEANNKVHDVVLNLAKFWFEGESELSTSIREEFKSIECFVEQGLSNIFKNEGEVLSNQEKFLNLAEIDLEKSNEKMLKVLCPIRSGFYGQEVYAELHLYQVINKYHMDLLGNLEICYIGKSNLSTFKRLRNHEKWGPILSSSENELYDYFAYFFVIDEAAIFRDNFSGVNIYYRNTSKLPKGAITEICESTLINHFKPKFNDSFVNSDVKKIGVIKKWLVNNGFNYVLTELELEGVMGRLETESKPYQVNQIFSERL